MKNRLCFIVATLVFFQAILTTILERRRQVWWYAWYSLSKNYLIEEDHEINYRLILSKWNLFLVSCNVLETVMAVHFTVFDGQYDTLHMCCIAWTLIEYVGSSSGAEFVLFLLSSKLFFVAEDANSASKLSLIHEDRAIFIRWQQRSTP